MEKNSIMRAVGFKMDNLKTFPFSRLPRDFQVEVLEKTSNKEKIKLFNVISGFRGFFARNGVFERDVDSISLSQIMLKDGEKNDLRISVRINYHDPVFHFPKYQALFRHIRWCAYIDLDFGDKQPLDELIEGKVDMKIGEWFPNLRFVRNLKVTNSARFYKAKIQLSESRHWEYLLKNQLSICTKVFITNRLMTDEILGMEIEKDSDKWKEIFDAFKKQGVLSYHYNHNVTKYYRKRITDDKEMMMIVVVIRG